MHKRATVGNLLWTHFVTLGVSVTPSQYLFTITWLVLPLVTNFVWKLGAMLSPGITLAGSRKSEN